MNDYELQLEQMGIDFAAIFQQALDYELYGAYFYETILREYYTFLRSDTGDAVWLAPASGFDRPYQVLEVSEADRLTHGIIPTPIQFEHCESIPGDYLEYSKRQDVEKKIREGGKSLAKKVNVAFIEVLRASVREESRIPATGRPLDEIMADGFSRLCPFESVSCKAAITTIWLLCGDCPSYLGDTIENPSRTCFHVA